MRWNAFVLFGLVAIMIGSGFQFGKAQIGDKEYEARHQLKKNQGHPNHLECDFYDKKFCLVTLTTVEYYEGKRHDSIWLNPGTKVVWLADKDDNFTITDVREDPSCEDADVRHKARGTSPFDTDIKTSSPVSIVETHVRRDAIKGTCFDIDFKWGSHAPDAKPKTIDPHVYVGDGS